MRIIKLTSGLIVLIITLSILFLTIHIPLAWINPPSNDRAWNSDQEVLQYSQIIENQATIYNIRNFSYKNNTNYQIQYYNKSYNFNDVNEIYYLVEHFSENEGVAHTFLTFEFENNSYISVSVEIRKEVGEIFSPLKGMFNNYELMFVWGDESDLIKLRTNHRNDQVYMYKINTTKEKKIEMFKLMLIKTNNLRNSPEYYNTIFNTCTTGILDQANKLREDKIHLQKGTILPGYSEKILYENNLIDTSKPLEQIKQESDITQKALTCKENCTNFSQIIRS